MGAAVLHSQGIEVTGTRVVDELSRMFTDSYGPWSRGIFLIGAFCTLFSTLIVGIAAFARMWGDMFTCLGRHRKDRHSESSQVPATRRSRVHDHDPSHRHLRRKHLAIALRNGKNRPSHTGHRRSVRIRSVLHATSNLRHLLAGLPHRQASPNGKYVSSVSRPFGRRHHCLHPDFNPDEPARLSNRFKNWR